MNDNKLSSNKAVHSDSRATFASVINTKLQGLRDEHGVNSKYETEFLLNSLPYIKRYYDERKYKPCENDDHEDNNISPINHNAKHDSSKTVFSSNEDIEKFITKKKTSRKGQLYNNFMEDVMKHVSTNNIRNESTSVTCDLCNKEMLIIHAEGSAVCDSCGFTISYQDYSDSYNQHANNQQNVMVFQFAYKRINHFREWISQIQAKESTIIPEEIIHKLLCEIKKERITDSKQITHERIKKYLKKIGYSKYYEHVPIIINKISGKPPARISYDVEHVLIDMFKKIQRPFERHCPPNRKNFLSYSYTLHKFSELLERRDLLVLFPLLKSRDKLYQQDRIWKKICEDLEWEFIPSL
jgi:hypothetical protein